jgi:hypothetical protein
MLKNVWYDILHVVKMNAIRISEWKTVVRKTYELIKVGKMLENKNKQGNKGHTIRK